MILRNPYTSIIHLERERWIEERWAIKRMILRHLYANKKILLDFRLLTGVDSSKIQLNIKLLRTPLKEIAVGGKKKRVYDRK